MSRQPLALIYNPTAGYLLRRRTALDKVITLLRAQGGEPELMATRAPGDAFLLARDAGRRFPIVVVMGGDGTANQVINGLVASGCSPPVLLLPGGSVNVLARDLHIPLDPCAAAVLLRDGIERRIFLGRAAERYFAVMAGAGLDASIVQRLGHRGLKRHLGPLAFVLEGLRHAVFYPFPRLTVRTDTDEITGYMAVIGNSPGYAGWFSITPGADAGQPAFQVAVCRSSFALKYFYFLALALGGALQRSRDFVYLETTRLQITSDKPAYVQVDGELHATLPMEFVSDGTSLRFLVPAPPKR